MTTWIDTNVLAALWSRDVEAQQEARRALRVAGETGWFAISGCVYAELIAGPDRNPDMVIEFLEATGIPVAWQTGKTSGGSPRNGFASMPSYDARMASAPKDFWLTS